MEMNQSLGYQTLALLLRKKKSLLNSHILHLCMSLAGSGEARESSAIPSTPAFSDLLCDLEVRTRKRGRRVEGIWVEEKEMDKGIGRDITR